MFVKRSATLARDKPPLPHFSPFTRRIIRLWGLRRRYKMSEGRCVLARSNSSGRIKRSFDNARGGGHNKTENQRPNVPVIPNRFGFFGFKQTPQSLHVSFQQHTYPILCVLIFPFDLSVGYFDWGACRTTREPRQVFYTCTNQNRKNLDQILVTFFPLLSKRAIFE